MELARNLKIDCVVRLHPTHPHRLDADSTIRDAVRVMRHFRVGCILVTRASRLVGIFTERDLLCRVLGRNRPFTALLSEVMTPAPITIQLSHSIRMALDKLMDGGHRHLPVTDEDGHPIGILSVKRIMNYLMEHYPGLYNFPDSEFGVSHPRGA